MREKRFITEFKIESNGIVVYSVDLNGKKGVQWLVDPNRVELEPEDIELMCKSLNSNFLPKHKARVTEKLNVVISALHIKTVLTNLTNLRKPKK